MSTRQSAAEVLARRGDFRRRTPAGEVMAGPGGAGLPAAGRPRTQRGLRASYDAGAAPPADRQAERRLWRSRAVRIAGTAVASWVALVVLAPPAGAAEELADLAAQVKPAVAHLVVYDGAGEKLGTATGFFISSDGLLATNHHVIEGAAEIEALLPEGGKADILGVIGTDAERDLAILKAEGDGYATLPLGDDADTREGARVAVIGGPLGLSWTLSEGIVSALRDGLPAELHPERELRTQIIQITAPISRGSSGSPVVTFDGKVIGVVQSTMPSASNVSFAVPVGALRELVARSPADAPPRPLKPIPWRNAIISAFVFGGLGLVYAVARLVGRQRHRRGPRLVR